PDRLIELKRNNVSENVILAMLSQGAVFTSGDDLADDAFFQDGNSNPSRGADGSKDEGASSGGSGGASKGEVKGRCMSCAHDDQTQTTGSATVRILRQTVANGSPAVRLENTPPLPPESVVQLVE